MCCRRRSKPSNEADPVTGERNLETVVMPDGSIQLNCWSLCMRPLPFCRHWRPFRRSPLVVFILRGVQNEELVNAAIRNTTEALLTRTRHKSAKVLNEVDLGDLFGIEMKRLTDFSAMPGKEAQRKKSAQPTATMAKTPTAPQKSREQPAQWPHRPGKQREPSPFNVIDQVATLIPAQ